MPSNVLPLHLKQTWIFTEGEGDGIESRVPFKIYSTLLTIWTSETQKQKTLLITLITLNWADDKQTSWRQSPLVA